MTWNVCQSFTIDKCRVLLLLPNFDYNRMRHLLFLKLTFIASRAGAIDKGFTWKWVTTHVIVCNIGYQASNREAQGLSMNDTRIVVFTLTTTTTKIYIYMFYATCRGCITRLFNFLFPFFMNLSRRKSHVSTDRQKRFKFLSFCLCHANCK